MQAPAAPTPAFAGKWTFQTSAGTYLSLKDAAGTLTLASPGSVGPAQYFNAYGKASQHLWLQASNWLYLVFTGTTYVASKARGNQNASFTVEDAGNGASRLVEKASDGKLYYLNAVGTTVGRVAKSANPPATTLFTQDIITDGMPSILQTGGSGLDLTGVYLAGQDFSNLNFLSCELSHAMLSGPGTQLGGCNFQGSTVNGTDFSGCNLDNVILSVVTGDKTIFDGVKLSSTTNFNGSVLSKVAFKNATNAAPPGIGTGPNMSSLTAKSGNFAGSNLSGASFSDGVFDDANFVNTNLDFAQIVDGEFTGAVLSFVSLKNSQCTSNAFHNATLASADFENSTITRCDFTKASLVNAKMSKAAGYQDIIFSGANLTGAVLTGMDLQSATLDADTNFTKAQMDGVNLNAHTLDGNNFLAASLQRAILTNTSFNNSILVGADMSNAVFRKGTSKTISFLGANLSNATLEGVNLTGAQMGATRTVGTIAADVGHHFDNQQLPPAFHDLIGKPGQADDSETEVTVHDPGSHWRVAHRGETYFVQKGEKGLEVQQAQAATAAAVLTNAFMPDAIFTGANLYAVNMSGVNWYGGSGKADNANLEQVNLSNANLSTLDLTQAKMHGANLSFAKLINTNFTKVALSLTSQQKPASLAFASMQGAVFTQAKLGGADLTNAAVSLKIDTDPGTLYGVPVFTLQDNTVATIAAALNALTITQNLVADFAAKNITVTTDDPVGSVAFGKLWIIRPATASTYPQYIVEYDAHQGVLNVYGQVEAASTATGKKSIAYGAFIGVPIFQILGDKVSAIIASLDQADLSSDIKTDFTNDGYSLIDSATIVAVEKNKRWIVYNADSNPDKLQSGYGQFQLVQRTFAGEVKYLQVFGGVPLLVTRTAADNKLTKTTVAYGATTSFSNTIMDATTTCPSGLKFGLLGKGVSYEELMTPGLPPHPPSCIPSPTHWCSGPDAFPATRPQISPLEFRAMSPTETALASAFKKAVHLEVTPQQIHDDVAIEALGISSMETVSLIFELEEIFGISIDTEEMFALKHISEVTRFIDRKVAEKKVQA